MSRRRCVRGKKLMFAPAVLDEIARMQDLEQGKFMGRLENEMAGDQSGLPRSKYNTYIAKVCTDWHTFAESG
jgi:hypothetical protein